MSTSLTQAVPFDIIMFVVFMGGFAFVMFAATYLIVEKNRLAAREVRQRAELADLKARHARAQALLDVPDQRIVIWEAAPETGVVDVPACRGTLPSKAGAPEAPAAFVAFGAWLTPGSAQDFAHAVDRLREHAESFDLSIETRTGTYLDVQGRISGNHAFARFQYLSGDKAALAQLENEHRKVLGMTDALQALAQALVMPVVIKRRDGTVTWANDAFVTAVDAEKLDDIADQKVSLLDRADREVMHREAIATGVSHQNIAATIAGDRRNVSLTAAATGDYIASLCFDTSAFEADQNALARVLETHQAALNEITSAVAIFDERRQLVFHNDAFESLWQFGPNDLKNRPDNSALLDQLRARGRVAEQPDWAKWRNGWLQVYAQTEPKQDWWHLPDGRTLRVVANPQKQGGVMWLFENITEQLDMQSRFTALTKVQGETLDHMDEAIAVFAPNGRLRLSNPSFQRIWALSDEEVVADTAIATLGERCKPMLEGDDADLWTDIKTAITGVSEARESVSGRIHLTDGEGMARIHDYALVPLPDGQTMVSFADVTFAVRMEETLAERNAALTAAERLKNAFIEHVSIAFRAPLTSIKGFSELLADKVFGPLNDKQVEYVADIESSANVLTALVDNLLDMAVLEAGRMELDTQPVNVTRIIEDASAERGEPVGCPGYRTDDGRRHHGHDHHRRRRPSASGGGQSAVECHQRLRQRRQRTHRASQG